MPSPQTDNSVEVRCKADGGPIDLLYGKPSGPHIRAQVRPVGTITFLERFSEHQEHKDESKVIRKHHKLIDTDWSIHPDEAAVDFELKNGETVIEKLSFPSLTQNQEISAEQSAAWNRVYLFSEEHGFSMGHLDQSCCDTMLETELERRIQSPRYGLMTPQPNGYTAAPSLG